MVIIMLIGIKNASRLIGISIISFCAVLVCTMFLNFYLDLRSIESEITSESSMIFYNAQVSTAKVVCLVSGGCLLITSVVMLIFYSKHYIDSHKKELGILKALGYSNLKIAKSFWVFGIRAFIGTAAGCGGAFLLMPRFYALQNKDKILPETGIHFHPAILLYFVILPTVGFSLLAIGYAWYQLKSPVLFLLKNDVPSSIRMKKFKEEEKRRDDDTLKLLASVYRVLLNTKEIKKIDDAIANYDLKDKSYQYRTDIRIVESNFEDLKNTISKVIKYKNSIK